MQGQVRAGRVELVRAAVAVGEEVGRLVGGVGIVVGEGRE
jgi:hypothetical protein